MSWRAGHLDPALQQATERLNELVRERLGPSWKASVSIVQTTAAATAAVDELLNVEQTAELLGKAPSTVRTLMQDGEIPAAKIGGTWYSRRSALLQLVPPAAENGSS